MANKSIPNSGGFARALAAVGMVGGNYEGTADIHQPTPVGPDEVAAERRKARQRMKDRAAREARKITRQHRK